MTPEDLDQIRQVVADSEARTTEAMREVFARQIRQAITESDARTVETMREVFAHQIRQAIAESEARTVETMRDIETKLLTAFHGYARGSLARVVRLETSDIATAERLSALEERVLALETQRPRP